MVMDLREKVGRILFSSLLGLLLLFNQTGIVTGQQNVESLSGNTNSSSVGDNFGLNASKPALSAELTKRIRQAADLRLKWRLTEAEALWREVLLQIGRASC